MTDPATILNVEKVMEAARYIRHDGEIDTRQAAQLAIAEGIVAVLREQPCAFAYVRSFVKEIEAEAWFPNLPDPPGECPCLIHRTLAEWEAEAARLRGEG